LKLVAQFQASSFQTWLQEEDEEDQREIVAQFRLEERPKKTRVKTFEANA
jgi:hypothetical protein